MNVWRRIELYGVKKRNSSSYTRFWDEKNYRERLRQLGRAADLKRRKRTKTK